MSKAINIRLAALSISLLIALPAGSADIQATEAPGKQSLPPQASADAPANDLSGAVLEKAQWVFENARQVHYTHAHVQAAEQVQFSDSKQCQARTDCSGFISFLLATAAPRHFEPVAQMQKQRDYPQAMAFEEFFQGLDTATPCKGWLSVPSFSALLPGDIIAWKKPRGPESQGRKLNSGHVMLVLDRPQAVRQAENGESAQRYVAVHVMDSSSVYHFPPEDLPPLSNQLHRDGLGKGYIRLILDAADNVIGYWEGTYWGEGQKALSSPTYTREIRFARLVPL